MSYQFHGEYVDQALRPLVAQLRSRYPGVRIVEAHYNRDHWGVFQQCMRYQAPLELLQHVGLVNEAMVRRTEPGCRYMRYSGTTALGDRFMLVPRLDEASRPGSWDLSIVTPAVPNERARIGVREASRYLRALCRRLDGAP